MARKVKNTVDYFPHIVHSGKTIYILENKYGNDGYAFWFKTLETLGISDNHYIDCRNTEQWEFMLAKMRVSEETANNILSTLSNLNAIDSELWGKKIIYSQNFIDNLFAIYERRKSKCLQKQDICKHLGIKCKQKPPLNGISDIKSTHSIVEDSIVEDSIVEYGENEVLNVWNTFAKENNLSLIKGLTEKRKSGINARSQEKEFNLFKILEEIKTSDFLLGKSGNWKVSFDFVFC
jgi:hypothetical protein